MVKIARLQKYQPSISELLLSCWVMYDVWSCSSLLSQLLYEKVDERQRCWGGWVVRRASFPNQLNRRLPCLRRRMLAQLLGTGWQHCCCWGKICSQQVKVDWPPKYVLSPGKSQGKWCWGLKCQLLAGVTCFWVYDETELSWL